VPIGEPALPDRQKTPGEIAPITGHHFNPDRFHLEKPIDYKVISNGVESKLFTMTLVDLPTVSKMELEYRYPAYTGLPPQKIENGGDVAALRGTEVFLHVVPSMNTPSGKILVNESESRPLTRQADGSLTGSFTIDKQGFYRIELEGPKGEKVIASPQYTIDVTADRSPKQMSFSTGRDTMATPVEELFVEAKASDDWREAARARTRSTAARKDVKLFGGAKPLTECRLDTRLSRGARARPAIRSTTRRQTPIRSSREVRVQRHLLVQIAVPQGLQAGAVAGRGRRRRRRRQRCGSAVTAAEGNRGRDLQRHPRQSEDLGGKAPRERGVPHLVARQAQDPGRRAHREDEEPSGRSG
jgi:hypothetical protein